MFRMLCSLLFKIAMRTAAAMSVKENSLWGALLYWLAAAGLAFGGVSVARAHPDAAQNPPVLVLPSPLFNGAGAVGDFDNDRQVDYVFASSVGFPGQRNRYRIQVHLTGHPSTVIELDPGIVIGLQIAALDIDRDKDLDLVITTRFGDPVGVWINDGDGTFSQGDLSAYAKSIWQQTGTSFEKPRRPDECRCPDFVPSTVSPVNCTIGLPIPGSTTGRRFRPVAERAALSAFNFSSPFRAPPVSSHIPSSRAVTA